MHVNLKIPLFAIVLGFLFACGSNKKVTAFSTAYVNKNAKDIMSWEVPYNAFTEELLALQELYEKGGYEGYELTIKVDTIQKKYLFTVYPEGVSAYKEAIKK